MFDFKKHMQNITVVTCNVNKRTLSIPESIYSSKYEKYDFLAFGRLFVPKVFNDWFLKFF